MEILQFVLVLLVVCWLPIKIATWLARHVFEREDYCGSCRYWFGIWEKYGDLCASPKAFKKLSLEGKNVELTHDPSRPKVVRINDVRCGKNCGRFCKYYRCPGAPDWTW